MNAPPKEPSVAPLSLHDTLTRSIRVFIPLHPPTVTLYQCGPTVYNYAHIGNLKKYINDDTLRRALEVEGYNVQQVINITDIGHLTSDADEGDDKMVQAIRREGLPMEMTSLSTVARKYEKAFVEDIQLLNISMPHHMPRASEWVPQQIALISQLLEKSVAYDTSHTVYFNAAMFHEYGKLGSIDLAGLQSGARISADPEKKGINDFALWKKSQAMGFSSPWGKGFPGWHIECSAMAMGLLGETIDIHTGGIEHIPVHHNNEIAQSECATGKQFVRYWLHSEFITIDESKMSKSKGNFITLKTLIDAGYHPLTYRYWVLNGHYHSAMNFSFNALTAAHNGLVRLHTLTAALMSTPIEDALIHPQYGALMHSAMRDDLNTSGVLAALWGALQDETISAREKVWIILRADAYLGIGLGEALRGNSPLVPRPVAMKDAPTEVQAWAREREAMRREKRFAEADQLREKIANAGFVLSDSADGPHLSKIHTPHPPENA